MQLNMVVAQTTVGVSQAVARLATSARAIAQSLLVQPAVLRLATAFKILSQSFSADQLSLRAGGMIRNMAQALNLQSSAVRAATMIRNALQAASASTVADRLMFVGRTLTQSIATTPIVSGLKSIGRTLAQAVSMNANSGRISAALRLLTQSANANMVAARVRDVFRSMTQSLAATGIAGRVSTFYRALAQQFGASITTQRFSTAVRKLAQSFSTSSLTSRISTAVRAASGQLSLSDIAKQAGYLYRTLLQSLTSNAAVQRIKTMSRIAAQNIVANSFMSRAVSFMRAIVQSANIADAASRIGLMIKTLTQSLSAASSVVYDTRLTLDRIVTSAMSFTANVVRLGNVMRTLVQNVVAADVAGRIASMLRAVTQAAVGNNLAGGARQVLRQLTQAMSANTVASKAASMLKLIMQSLTSNAVVSKIGSLVRAAAQTLSADTLASRIGIIGRALSQWFGFSDATRQSFEFTYNKVVSMYMTMTGAVGRGFDAVRAIPQFVSANGVSGRLALLARLTSQNLNASAIGTRLSSAFRSLAQSMSAASQLSRVVFKSYEAVATAVMNMTGSAGRMLSALSSVIQTLTGNVSVGRLFAGFRSLGDSLGMSSATARIVFAARGVTQSLFSVSTAIRMFVAPRVASVSFAFGDVAARLASMSRAASQFLSVQSLTKIPAMVFDRMVSVLLFVSGALERIRMSGRFATGAITFADFTSRLAEIARTSSQSLNVGSITARAAAFYRNAFTALSVLFGWLFRFPAWFYYTQASCTAAGYNWCSGSCSAYACGTYYNYTYVAVIDGVQADVNVTTTNLTVSFLPNATLGTIKLESWLYGSTPAATTLADDTDVQAVKYFNVTANSTLNETTLQWFMTKFVYTDSEISNAGLVESTLSLYAYNLTLSRWTQLTNSSLGVFGTGVDNAGKYAWANMTNTSLNLYAIGGLYVNGHACSASAECYSSACCSGNCQSSCAAPTPVSPGGGGGAVITPPAESEVKYKKIAVLREVVPGQTVVVGVEVKNEGAIPQKDMVLAVSGVPESWIYTSVSNVSMQSSETKGFNIVVTPPVGAEPGDYKVTLKLKNANIEAENFFIVRVRYVPSDYDKPIVTRQVGIDMESGKTNVDLVVSNPYREVERINVIENIPKELANSTEYVDFGTKPSEIVREDPIVMWSITGMMVGETKTLSYSVSKVLQEFTPYIYWPLRQLDVISPAVPNTLKLTGFMLPYFTAGTSSAISFKVKNMDTAQHNFTLEMELPAGWKMEPEMIKETIGPGEEKEFKTIVTPAADAKAGRYMVRTAFGWDGTYVVKEYVADVTTFEVPLIIIAAIAAVFVMGAWYSYRLSKAEAQLRDRFVLREKLGRIRNAISTSRPEPTGREALKSELNAVTTLSAGMAPIARRAGPAYGQNRLAMVEKVKNILRRKNKPWRNYWS